MAPKCPFCTEEEFERKGCNHRLLSLKYTFCINIVVDAWFLIEPVWNWGIISSLLLS